MYSFLLYLGNNGEAPKLGDPGYAKWYYKQCYGVDPDEENEQYKQWAKSLSQMASGETAAGDDDKSEADESAGKKKDEISTENAHEQKEGNCADSSDDKGPKAKKRKPEPSMYEVVLKSSAL